MTKEEQEDDEIIVVKLRRADYEVLRAMIDDRRSVYRVARIMKQTLTLTAGVIVSWLAIKAWIGKSVSNLLKGSGGG